MNFKIPIIGAIVSFVLLFIINLIVGNGFGTVVLRSLISAAIVLGLLFGMLFVFQKFLGIDSSTFNEDETQDKDNDNAVGQQFDLTVGDDDSVVDTADYNNEETTSNSESSNDSGEYSDTETEDSSFYDQGFSDAGTSGGDLTADTVKEKLGYDATTEDLAKAIRTIMPRDD